MSIIKANFYCYVIYDPRPEENDARRYVGKTKSKYRPLSHLRGSHNEIVRRFIAKCRRLGLTPDVEIIAYFEHEADALAFEVERIAKYGRKDLGTGTLYNLTDGGEGAVNHVASRKQRMAAAASMRKLHADPVFKAAQAERLRKLQSDPVYLEALAERARIHMHKMNADPKFREEASARMLKLNADPEYIERMRKMRAEPEFKAAQSARSRKLHADPEYKAANAERMRKRRADPEFIAALAKSRDKLNADPEYKAANAERMRKRRADPEFIAALAESMSKLNADPEFRAANAERGRESMLKLFANPVFRAAQVARNKDPEFQVRAQCARRPHNASGFRGIDKRKHRWRARIRINRSLRSLGNFNTPEEAARAYDRAAIDQFGEFAVLNFPPSICRKRETEDA